MRESADGIGRLTIMEKFWKNHCRWCASKSVENSKYKHQEEAWVQLDVAAEKTSSCHFLE